VDQIDGFPNFKRKLLDLYGGAGGVALIAGAIHAAFATEHQAGIWEFTAPAISSSVFRNGVLSAVSSDPTLSQIPGLAGLVTQLDALLAAANDRIRYVDTAVNGIVVLEAAASGLSATYWQIDGEEATKSYYLRPLELARKLTIKRMEVPASGATAAVPRHAVESLV
jgi:alkaline phosphatase D